MRAKSCEKFSSHPALERALKLAETYYPNLEINVARDAGDVIDLFLEDVTTFRPRNSRIAHYNKWYDEITFYRLEPIDYDQESETMKN